MKFGRLLVAFAVMSVMASGCATSRQTRTIGGTALTLAGGLLVAYHPNAECTNRDGTTDAVTQGCTALIAQPMNGAVDVLTTVLGAGMIAVGGGLLVSAALDETAAPAPAPIGRVEDRLEVEAIAAARSGQCTPAVSAATELSLRDRERFDRLVAADSHLARCYGGY